LAGCAIRPSAIEVGQYQAAVALRRRLQANISTFSSCVDYRIAQYAEP
jgi:hypothetical protein